MDIKEIEQENDAFVLQAFDLAECMAFMKAHSVEVYRLPDWQFACSINGKVFDIDISFFSALINGISQFKKLKENETTT